MSVALSPPPPAPPPGPSGHRLSPPAPPAAVIEDAPPPLAGRRPRPPEPPAAPPPAPVEPADPPEARSRTTPLIAIRLSTAGRPLAARADRDRQGAVQILDRPAALAQTARATPAPAEARGSGRTRQTGPARPAAADADGLDPARPGRGRIVAVGGHQDRLAPHRALVEGDAAGSAIHTEDGAPDARLVAGLQPQIVVADQPQFGAGRVSALEQQRQHVPRRLFVERQPQVAVAALIGL